jgi:hypothetical protein
MDGSKQAAFDNEVYAFIRGDDGLSFGSVLSCLFVLAKARSDTDPLRILLMMNERERINAVSGSLERLWKAGRAVETPGEDGKKTWHAVLPTAKPKARQKGLGFS